jgi:hypothetical protein
MSSKKRPKSAPRVTRPAPSPSPPPSPDATPPATDDKTKNLIPTEEDGIPLPPGYFLEAINFDSPEGQELVHETCEKIGRSITFTPLITSLGSCIMLFLMSGALFMALGSMWTIGRNGFGAISTAMMPNHRLTWQSRMMMITIGLGLLLFLMWRASAIGLLGGSVSSPAPDKSPVFFSVT